MTERSALTYAGELAAVNDDRSDSLHANPLIHSTLYSLQAPLDALSQLGGGRVDRIPPPAKPRNNWEWCQQQAGFALGSLPYLVLLHKVTKSILSPRMLSADVSLLDEAGSALGPEALRQVARRDLAAACATGSVYGGLLTPVGADEMHSPSDFALAKTRSALVGGTTFTVMTGSMLGLRALAERAGDGLLGTARLLKESTIVTGFLSGAPAGVAASQMDSLLRRGRLAPLEETREAALGFMLIGALLPAGQRFVDLGLMKLQQNRALTNPTYHKLSTLSESNQRQLARPLDPPEVPSVDKVFSAEELAIINEWKAYQAGLDASQPQDFHPTAQAQRAFERAGQLSDQFLADIQKQAADPEVIRELAAREYGSGAGAKDRVLHMILGNCGAGKSRITQAQVQRLNAIAPDSDSIKPLVKGYEPEPGRLGFGNQSVHPVSEKAYEKVFYEMALPSGDNVVWQGVGKTQKNVESVILAARKEGYKVFLDFVDSPPEVAARRVFQRALIDVGNMRQMIPPERPLSPTHGGYLPRQTFFRIIGAAADPSSEMFAAIDGFKIWNSAPGQFIPNPVLGAVRLKPLPLAGSQMSVPVADGTKRRHGSVRTTEKRDTI